MSEALATPDRPAYEFGPFRLIAERRALLRDGHDVPLAGRSFDLLLHLVANAGRVVSKDQLLSAVWPDVVVEEGNLTVAMSAIRRALGEEPGQRRYVATIKGHGYQFVAPVRAVSAALPGVTIERETTTEIVAEELVTGDETACLFDSDGTLARIPTSARTTEAAPIGRTARRRWLWGLGIPASLLAGALITAPPRSAGPRTVVRFTLQIPPLETADLNGITISPDGQHVVYHAPYGDGSALFHRRIDRLESTPIRGTVGGEYPFFSPDGRWVGFFAENALKKVPLDGGPAVVLCPAGVRMGASWGPNGVIVFASNLSTDVMAVPETGGTPEPLVTAAALGGMAGRWPVLLPGGRAVVVSRQRSGLDTAELVAYDLETKMARVLTAGTGPAYTSTGHLVFARQNALWAAPFDMKGLRFEREPVAVVEEVQINEGGLAMFGLGLHGALVVLPKLPEARRTLEWVSRTGDRLPLSAARGPYDGMSLSPDGRQLLLSLRHASGVYEAWTVDLGRDVLTRIAPPLGDTGMAMSPVWTPDGRRIVFQYGRFGERKLMWVPADGSAAPETLTASTPFGHHYFPSSISPDGRWVAADRRVPAAADDIVVFPLGRDTRPRVLVATAADERRAQFSPDGRWIAYESTESGNREVYVRSFSASGPKIRVSADGGERPFWPRQGLEIFYRRGTAIMAAPVTVTASHVTVASARRLFDYAPQPPTIWSAFTATADGARFAMIKDAPESKASALQVTLNWLEELRDRVPPAR